MCPFHAFISYELRPNAKFSPRTVSKLEQRQNKNDSIQSKIIPMLKLPRFILHRTGGEKARQFKVGIIFD